MVLGAFERKSTESKRIPRDGGVVSFRRQWPMGLVATKVAVAGAL